MMYRKKSIIVDAWLFDGTRDSVREVLDDNSVQFIDRTPHGASSQLDIITLEGTMTANVGEWIIKGIKGELYPCKPDIFEATYEKWRQEPVGDCSGSYDGSGSAYNYKER